MRRYDYTTQEADKEIAEIRMRVMQGEDPEEILYDELGLEPDYIFDII